MVQSTYLALFVSCEREIQRVQSVAECSEKSSVLRAGCQKSQRAQGDRNTARIRTQLPAGKTRSFQVKRRRNQSEQQHTKQPCVAM
jgi:hypothetical protein